MNREHGLRIEHVFRLLSRIALTGSAKTTELASIVVRGITLAAIDYRAPTFAQGDSGVSYGVQMRSGTFRGTTLNAGRTA